MTASAAHIDTLHPVLPGGRRWPLFDTVTSRDIEAHALGALPAHTLMQRAGLAVARLLLATQPRARHIHVLAGPGNNGGDALVAATLLHKQGLQVRVSLLADAARLPADAAQALAHAGSAGVVLDTALPARIDADVAVDGLLGLGLSRAPDGDIARAIGLLNDGPTPVLSIDLPSGLDADRGVPVGATAVRASETLALLTLKPGLFTAHGRDHAGRIWVDALGVDLPPARSHLIGADEALAGFAALPPHASHKGSFGDVLVVGGTAGMAGASALAARAALAAGAGRVYACTLGGDPTPFDPLRPELMRRTAHDCSDPRWLAETTVVAGCGAGDDLRGLLPPLLAHAARLVLDADALNRVAAEPGLADALRARSRRHRATVLTPHPLEAARLLGIGSADVQANRLDAARTLAQRYACVVVLKGSGSVVAHPDGDCAVNSTGNALLATPGSGDVLAGWLGGLWARHALALPLSLASAAVWRHGRAADLAAAARPQVPNLPANDLIDAMRRVGA